MVESFFGSLKKERIKKQIYKNRSLAEADIRDYIEAFYNPSRRNSHLDGVSPDPVRIGSSQVQTRCPLNPGNSRTLAAQSVPARVWLLCRPDLRATTQMYAALAGYRQTESYAARGLWVELWERP